MKRRPLLSIVVPCLNEKGTILEVIKDARKFAHRHFPYDFEIVVADNGSTDGTLDILSKVKGIRVVNVPVKGYGAALHWGIMRAKGKYVLFADADLSYPFSNIKRFKKKVSQDPDLILGSRLKGSIQKGAMPLSHRYLGTPILTFLIRLLYKIRTTDCNSGMRMVKKSFYKKLNMRNSGMEWASELLLKTAIKKGNYLEVPIRFVKDRRDKSSHLSTWADGWRHLKAILLLKPSTIYPLLVLFPLLAYLFYPYSFGLTFLFLDLTVVVFLSLLTLNLLGAIIEDKQTGISEFLLQFKLVPIVALISLFVGLTTISIPDTLLGTKLFLVSVLGILFMWIFLVETIKTHLANRLPDV